MPKYHGITTETYKHFIVDAGAVYKNYVDGDNPGEILGATRDGSTFTLEREIREMTVDGSKGPTKGYRRVTKVTARISAKFIEFRTDLLKLALPGTTSTEEGNYDQIRSALNIALDDYLENIVLIGEKSGTNEPIILGIENPLADGGFEVAMIDEDEAGITIQFTAHFDPEDLAKEPWFILNPKVEEEEPGEVGLLDLDITGDSPIVFSFIPETHNYEVDVTQASSVVIITATMAGVSKSSITINGETTVNPSWKLGIPVELEAGANPVVITVNAGGELDVYTIIINYTGE